MMKLAAFSHPPGSNASSWRLPDAAADSDMNLALYIEVTQAAERGKMDAIFFQDSLAVNQSYAIGRRDRERAHYPRAVTIEPLMLLPALAMVTSHIGLIATATTTYDQPYLVARHASPSIPIISAGAEPVLESGDDAERGLAPELRLRPTCRACRTLRSPPTNSTMSCAAYGTVGRRTPSSATRRPAFISMSTRSNC